MPRAATASGSEEEKRTAVPIGNSVLDAPVEVSTSSILEKSAPSVGTGSSAGRENCSTGAVPNARPGRIAASPVAARTLRLIAMAATPETG